MALAHSLTHEGASKTQTQVPQLLARRWHHKGHVLAELEDQRECEYRFLLTSAEARSFVEVSSEHLVQEVYDTSKPVSYTRTTYYDSEDRQLWRQEKAGQSRRVRVRQYASADSITALPKVTDTAFFELKESSGDLRTKLRFSAAPERLHALLSGEAAEAELAELAHTPALLRLAQELRTAKLRPVFSTWYRRVTLANQSVRLTIDENVSFCPPLALAERGSWATPVESFDMISGRIVELKVLGPTPEWLVHAMATLSGTETVSKFNRGMQLQNSPHRTRQAGTRPLAILAPMRARTDP